MRQATKLVYALTLIGSSSLAIASPWPQSFPDSAMTESGLSITVSVLANDIGDNLTLKNSNDWTKQGGRTTIIGSSVRYTPPNNFSGVDEFWYSFFDNQNRASSGKVTVKVSASEYTGWPQSLPDYAESKGGEAITIPVLANDIGKQLQLKSANDWSKHAGRTTIVGSTVKYTPHENFSGTDEFWYSFADYKGRTNSAKVTVKVSAYEYTGWPVSTPDYAESKNGQSITIPVLANDKGKQLQLQSSNDWTENGGRTTIVGDSVKYIPPANFSGTDTFWYDFSDYQNRANSAKVSVEVSAALENSVVEFCGNTYESDGTKTGTRLTNLSPEPLAKVPPQPEVVNGEISIDDRIYSIDDTVSPQILRMKKNNVTTTIVTSSTNEAITIVGGHKGKVYFLVDQKTLYSHNGITLNKITDSIQTLVSEFSILGTVADGWEVTGIESVAGATDNFYFAVEGERTREAVRSVWRIDGITGQPVYVGDGYEWSLGSNAGQSFIDTIYYFKGLDYYGVSGRRSGMAGGPYGLVHQRTSATEVNTLDAGLEGFFEDRNRLFIITKVVPGNSFIGTAARPSKLYVVGDDNQFIELNQCEL